MIIFGSTYLRESEIQILGYPASRKNFEALSERRCWKRSEFGFVIFYIFSEKGFRQWKFSELRIGETETKANDFDELIHDFDNSRSNLFIYLFI